MIKALFTTKQLNITLLLISLCLFLNAETVDTNSYFGEFSCWTYVRDIQNEQEDYKIPYTAKIQGDTIINNIQYKKYYGFDLPIIAIRQENKKIFAINEKSISEYLLYDFGLKVGDCIIYDGQYPDGEQVKGCVQKIDSITLTNGEKYKRMVLQNHIGSEVWIEGIGNLDGFHTPFYPQVILPCNCWDYYRTICFKRENVQLINNSDYDISCNCDNIESRKTFPTSDAIWNIQTKGNGTLLVNCNSNIPSFKLQLFNLMGQQVFDKEIHCGSIAFPIQTNLLTGIYIYQILDKEKQLTTGKVHLD